MDEQIARRVTIQNCALDAALHYNPSVVEKKGVLRRGTVVKCVNCMPCAGAKPQTVVLEQVPHVTSRGRGPINTLRCPEDTNCVGHTPDAQVMNVVPRTQ